MGAAAAVLLIQARPASAPVLRSFDRVLLLEQKAETSAGVSVGDLNGSNHRWLSAANNPTHSARNGHSSAARRPPAGIPGLGCVASAELVAIQPALQHICFQTSAMTPSNAANTHACPYRF